MATVGKATDVAMLDAATKAAATLAVVNVADIHADSLVEAVVDTAAAEAGAGSVVAVVAAEAAVIAKSPA